ncbi:MAG TPA: PKD domain-containing protein, partial [Gaiellaceae bacterium]|nr:PKD domain-containing protein [Gaiellaceae bacterium]
SVAVNWGDGSDSFQTTSQGPISRSHTYDDNGTYAATVTVTDKDGGASDEKSFNVSVANVAPTATFSNNGPVDEGSSFTLSMTNGDDASSADQAAKFTFAFDCGDGTGYGPFTTTPSLSASYDCGANDNGSRSVKAKIRDKDGGVHEYSDSVTVRNVPPSATFNAPSSVNEGDDIDLSLTSPSDPSSVDAGAGFNYAFDCGDGLGYSSYGASNTRSCPTNDNGTRTVRGKIRDKDGGEREYTKQVAVGNSAPRVTITSPEFGRLYAKPAVVTVNASFTDAGKGDTHTCSVNWDDGTSSPGTVSEANGSGTCSGTHTYNTAGVYTIKVTVTDDEGASGTAEVMIVVYDPSAGFVTGGGWIDVAAGSYRADPTLAGRANFGFTSKYKNGASTPTGETEFNFQVGNFKFHSANYQWLVVSGYKAQYKGTGQVNGVSGYDFRLTAYDGQIAGAGNTGADRFRIKITKQGTGEVVFDNRLGNSDDIDQSDPQAISGGSIVIHKA